MVSWWHDADTPGIYLGIWWGYSMRICHELCVPQQCHSTVGMIMHHGWNGLPGYPIISDRPMWLDQSWIKHDFRLASVKWSKLQQIFRFGPWQGLFEWPVRDDGLGSFGVPFSGKPQKHPYVPYVPWSKARLLILGDSHQSSLRGVYRYIIDFLNI